jgi:ribosomal protein S18 acetylase RimI-like enzyme
VDLSARRYAGEDDFWRVRAFLRRLLLEAELHPRAWHVVRWDYWRWHGVNNCGAASPEATVTLWETSDGEIVAMANPENRGDAFLQADPRVRCEALDVEMLAVAEERLTERGRLLVWVPASDRAWPERLAAAGYERVDEDESVRAATLHEPLPTPRVAAGYRIRALREGGADFPARGDLSLRVFHPVPDGSTAMTEDDYRHVQRGPLYRRDLDLVAEAEDGSLAAFVTIWFDDVTRTAVVEPAGTDAPHRRRGLGRALLLEGLGRARWLGATTAYVGSYGEAAHALYASVGLHTVEHLVGWRRRVAPRS